MVDNRGIGPISNPGFKSDNAMANKMSEEKNGQGSEYFAQEMEEEQEQEKPVVYQDRSAQLRASLNGLAMANVGSIMFKKMEFEKRFKKKIDSSKQEIQKEEHKEKEELFEEN